jgi:hypothetical protein
MKAIILTALAITMLPVLSFAGDADKGLPKIKVTWKPSFQEKFITLSITNNGTNPIAVRSKLKLLIVNPGGVVAKLVEEPDPEAIVPSIEFTDTVPFAIKNEGGAERIPINIAPGETKVIKFPMNEDLIAAASNSSEATFLLKFHNKVFNKVTMKEKNGVLKQE